LSKEAFSGLFGRCRWDDPARMTGKSIPHVPVHLCRHRQTALLHVILVADEIMACPPTYIVNQSELILPPGGLPD
jgi:hypothetical protein